MKERLVGASILVVLIVLIVPELLSGPAPAPVGPRLPMGASEPVRNVTVDLATAKAPEPEPAVDAASSAQLAATQGAMGAGAAASAATHAPPVSAAPAGAASSAVYESAAPAPKSAASTAAPPAASRHKATSSAPLESAAPAPTSAAGAKPANGGHAWTVQLGSFASRANADKLVRQVRAQGFSVYLSSSGSGASQRYRVRIGPMADRSAATQAAAKLKALGHIGSIVPPAA